jgi:tRNA-specific 2-thiouridylase
LSQDKVIVAMSGGVDSSVAALLLKGAGYEVVGVTMKLYSLDQQDIPDNYRGCCTVDDAEDARRVCQRLGIPHYVFNLQKEFRTFVIDYFCEEYRMGRTPHPCIACNDKIKFSFLSQRASSLGAKYVATGHYARIAYKNDTFKLLKGLDNSKDQSYVLYGMGQNELDHTLLPVGWYTKEQIRQMALEADFPNALKPDSQDICFIPSGDYKSFLKEHITSEPGYIVDSDGNILGEHGGIEGYTVGQRRGLGIAGQQPMYVLGIDHKKKQVTVGLKSELYRETLWTNDVSYIGRQEPVHGTPVTVKIRYKSPECGASIYPYNSNALIRFERAQRAITPGQAVVFYQGDEVLGGGRISDQQDVHSAQVP